VDSNENYRSLIRCIGWFGLIIPKLRNITQVVRILPPPRAWIGVRLAHAKPKCFGDSRDAKNDSIWVRDAKYNAAGAMHRASMGATELQSNWPDMRKTLGKPGFCSGEDRNRTTYKFPGKNWGSKMRRRKIRRAPQNTPCAACCMRALRLSLGH
jgi:hypothetical protein